MKPYKTLNLPLEKLDWARFISLVGKANAEIARFDRLLQSIPNPKVLLSPLTTKEAVLSSKIEGTQATLKEVLEFEANPEKNNKKYDDIQEILNYRKAMNYAIDNLKRIPLCARLLKEIHNILLDSVRGKYKNKGEFRKDQVFIGRPGSSIEQASFVPVAPENIENDIKLLENYINYDDKDFLIQLAIIHVQFEMIHPFDDGNGRTGRIILPLFLYYKKVLSIPMFYLSEYLESHREEYYYRLKAVSQNNEWEEWIIYFLNAIIEQSKINTAKAQAIHFLYNNYKEIMEKIAKSFAIKTLDFIFKHPVFKSNDFIKITKISKSSAFRILDLLEKNEILIPLKKNDKNRNKSYMFQKLLNITK